jgi:putative membrane protein
MNEASRPPHEGASNRLALSLLIALVTQWVLLAWAPVDRQTWVLENVLLVLFVGALVVSWPRFRFSAGAYLLMYVFLMLHVIGGHYTYSLVPYDRWFDALTGSTLSALTGWSRNHYDRLLHFLFGLLLALPAAQMLRHAGVPERLCPRLAVLLLMACSSLYELIEWAAALVFGGDLGVHYLGTQGDVWDGQRDMALAALGAVLAMLGPMIRGCRATRRRAHRPEQSRRAACGNSSSALDTGAPRRAAACRRMRRGGYRT